MTGVLSGRAQPRFALYLAVLPEYRAQCVRLLKGRYGDSIRFFASEAHLNRTIRTGIDPNLYHGTRMVRLGRKAFIQLGGWTAVMRAGVTVLDLNPRSLSAWLLLGLRKLAGRKTLLWGHLHPKAGQGARSARLRRWMRAQAHGFLSYTYADAGTAREELPGQPVWVAANALYSREETEHELQQPANGAERSAFIYVGRLERMKKVHLAIHAFDIVAAEAPDALLYIVGDGTEHARLKELAAATGAPDRITFFGWQSSFEILSPLYRQAVSALSPGAAGLAINQSMVFGLPIITSIDERHGPEIELADSGAVVWHKTDDVDDLAQRMLEALASRDSLPRRDYIERIRDTYSAEAMAHGIDEALRQLEAPSSGDS